MKYIQSFELFESVSQARSILKSLDKDINDDSYLKIRELLRGHDGYVGWFAKLHYKLGYNLNSLVELWNLIESNSAYISKLPKQLITYDDIEKVQDDLEIVKNESSYNRILGEFPNKQKAFIKDSDKVLLQNLAKRKDNKSFFRKIASYHTRKSMIDALKTFLSVDPNSTLDKVMKTAKEDGSDIIHYSYENNILIVRVYNSAQLRKIAGDCSWCIRTESTFRSYVNNESKQFIIFLFDRIDNLSRIGVTARLDKQYFYHTAHDKNDRGVSYKSLKDLLSEYDVDTNDFMSFKLEDININTTSVKRLMDTFKLSKEDIVKVKLRFTTNDLSQFDKEEIEEWNLLDKSELGYSIITKYDWSEVVSKKLLNRVNDLSIFGITHMYNKFGYVLIDYLKKNPKILESLQGTIYRSEKDDLAFYKEYILGKKIPNSSYGLGIGSTFSDKDRYSYERTLFRLLWFKDELKALIDKDPIVIKQMILLEGSDSKMLRLLKDMGIKLDDIKKILADSNFKFDKWLGLIKLYKEEDKDVSDIIDYVFKYIKSYSISEYEMSRYKESGIFSEDQIEKLEYTKLYKEFVKDIPSNPYSREMTTHGSKTFYDKWKDNMDDFISKIDKSGYDSDSRVRSLILAFTKLDKLSELEKFNFKFSSYSGKEKIAELSRIISGTYITNGGMSEDLTEEQCKKLYKFITTKCDISDLNLGHYSVDGETIEARSGDIRNYFLPTMYLYDRNEFDNYLIYEVSNLKFNVKKDDVFVPVPGDKTKNITNRVYPVTSMIEFFLKSKKKPDISEFEEFITNLISFSLTLPELTYLINQIEYRISGYYKRDNVDISSNIKRMLKSELERKTRNQKILLKYRSFLS